MFKLVIVGTIMAAASAMRHPVNSQIVHAIRSKDTTWEAHEPETNPLRNYSIEKLKGMLGLILNHEEMDSTVYREPMVVEDKPSEFDWRKQHPSCVHDIRDQEQCGSCWAFAGSETLSDRFCIASEGKIDVVLSPQDMVSCDAWDLGCNGGILPWAWSYLEKTGVVTDECMPYTSGNGKVGSCPKKCQDDSEKKKYKCVKGSVVKASGIEAIQSEVLANGPVETGFTVYEDFFNYKSGVYHHVSGGVAGGHAIKVIGYGVESNTPYWLCANSWGGSWGMSGFFKIKQGDSGINQQMYGCTPDVKKSEFELF